MSEEWIDVRHHVNRAIAEAEAKAWDSLARYKFQMFGYWASIWVHLNRISGAKRSNPFADVVKLARRRGDPEPTWLPTSFSEGARSADASLPTSGADRTPTQHPGGEIGAPGPQGDEP